MIIHAVAINIGLSIGKVNYRLKALVDIGFDKVGSFTKSTQKIKYVYNLMPRCMQEKAAITRHFIIKNKQEYDKLMSYID